MKARAIARHNEAVAAITKQLIKCPDYHDSLIIADLGIERLAAVATESAFEETVMRQMPADMQQEVYTNMQTLLQQHDEELCTILQSSAHFPDLADTMHLVCTMPDDELIAHLRKKYPLKPDIMIKVAANKRTQPGKSPKQRDRVLLVEIGYCREGFARSKMAEKQNQHRLARYLMQQMGHDVKYCTVTLGVTGALYSDLEEMMTWAKAKPAQKQKLWRKLMHIALNHTHGMVVQRRQLENAPQTTRPYKRKRPPDK